MTLGDDDESSGSQNDTHGTTNRTTNLLIFSNVHFVHLGRDNNNNMATFCFSSLRHVYGVSANIAIDFRGGNFWT